MKKTFRDSWKFVRVENYGLTRSRSARSRRPLARNRIRTHARLHLRQRLLGRTLHRRADQHEQGGRGAARSVVRRHRRRPAASRRVRREKEVEGRGFDEACLLNC